MKLPSTIKIFDSVYKIEYFDSHLKVDPEGKEELAGIVDHSSSTIRIYNGSDNIDDVFQILWHEVLHSVGEKLKIKYLRDDNGKADDNVDMLAIAINTIIRDNIKIFADKDKKPRKKKIIETSEIPQGN